MAGKIEINALVIGRGAREHALAWKLNKSPVISEVFVAPGNAGTTEYNHQGRNVEIGESEISKIVDYVKDPRNRIGLVVPGSEAPLAAGITNALYEAGMGDVFGPTQEAARLESSKIYAIEIMREKGIPYPNSEFYYSAQEALSAVGKPNWNKKVMKADGLTAGKGVSIVETAEEAEQWIHDVMVKKIFGDAGNAIIMQTREIGPEASVFAFCDGGIAVPVSKIPHDYKPAYDGNKGPNTGGMGTYIKTPDDIVSSQELAWIQKNILQPTVDAMRERGHPYKGILYAGLIKTKDGFKVLEFNVRGGDPEFPALLPILKSDFVNIALASSRGCLRRHQVLTQSGAVVNVVLASGGYPGKYTIGKEIYGLDQPRDSGILIFHAGTKEKDNKTETNGGRVLDLVAVAENLELARKAVYSSIGTPENHREKGKIYFDGMQYRTDVGLR